MATGARLLLMRHCKSSWKEYNEANYFHQQSLVLSGNDYNKMNNDVHVTSMSDAMRSLNKRGRRDAVRVGRELAKRGLIGVGMGIGKSASSHSTLSMKVKNGQESGIVTEEVEWQEEDGETRNTENNESRVTLPAICSVDTTIPVFTSHAVRCRETLHRMMVGASQSKESISSCNDSEDGKIGSWKADDGWWPRSNMIHVEQDLYAASEKVDSIVDVLKKPVQAAFEKNLHHSSKNDRVQWSRSALHTSTVMLLGHNPGMELLARSLVRDGELDDDWSMTTGNVIVLCRNGYTSPYINGSHDSVFSGRNKGKKEAFAPWWLHNSWSIEEIIRPREL